MLISSEEEHNRLLAQLKYACKLEHIQLFKDIWPLLLDNLQSHLDYSYPTIEFLLTNNWNNNKRNMLNIMMEKFNPISPNEIKEYNLIAFLSYGARYSGRNNQHHAEFLKISEQLLEQVNLQNEPFRHQMIKQIETLGFWVILPTLLEKGFAQDLNYLKLSVFDAIMNKNQTQGEEFLDNLLKSSAQSIQSFIQNETYQGKTYLAHALYEAPLSVVDKLLHLGARLTDTEMLEREEEFLALPTTTRNFEFYKSFLIEDEKRKLEESLPIDNIVETKKQIKL